MGGPTDPVAAIRRELPGLAVSTDGLDLYGADIFYEAEHPPLAIVRPEDTATIAALVRLASRDGFKLVPRGGGMSYSGGYLPADARTVTVDLTGMSRIPEINAEDRYVTVEAGVTWAALRDALAPLGLTVPVWGTFSGRHATIGGSLSQGAKFFGSGHRGTTAESVLGLTVVTGSGETLTTGSAGAASEVPPFYRNYGPDLTGLFLQDSGAFGFKVAATLQLVPAPGAIETAAFSVPEADDILRLLGRIGAERLASEAFALDPQSVRARLKGEGLGRDLATLRGIVASGSSLLDGVVQAARVAGGGRRFARDSGFLLNVVCEGRDRREARTRMARVRRLAAAGGGREVAASIPAVMRADPFPEIRTLLTGSGRRINWLHTIVPNSRAVETFRATEAVYAEHAGAVARHGITWGYVLTANGPSAVGIETLVHFPGAPLPLHQAVAGRAGRPDFARRPADPEARAAVERIGRAIVASWQGQGGVHLQIGRKYPYFESRAPGVRSLLVDLKRRFDPQGVIAPGNLLPWPCPPRADVASPPVAGV